MLSLEITRHINESTIIEIVNMDHTAYPPSDQITWERAYSIYNKVGDSLILLKDNDMLIGYISVFNVNLYAVFHALEQHSAIYEQPMSELLDLSRSKGGCYIHNIIIKPEYQGKGFRQILFYGLKCWVLEHSFGGSFWADVVTDKGAKACNAMGMSPISSSSHIWFAEYEAVSRSMLCLSRQPDIVSRI